MLLGFKHQNILIKSNLGKPYSENNENENCTYQSTYLKQGGYALRKHVKLANSETDASRNMEIRN